MKKQTQRQSVYSHTGMVRRRARFFAFLFFAFSLSLFVSTESVFAADCSATFDPNSVQTQSASPVGSILSWTDTPSDTNIADIQCSGPVPYSIGDAEVIGSHAFAFRPVDEDTTEHCNIVIKSHQGNIIGRCSADARILAPDDSSPPPPPPPDPGECDKMQCQVSPCPRGRSNNLECQKEVCSSGQYYCVTSTSINCGDLDQCKEQCGLGETEDTSCNSACSRSNLPPHYCEPKSASPDQSCTAQPEKICDANNKGGFIPCARSCNDPDTEENEMCPCTLCHLISGIKRIIDWGMIVLTYFAITIIVVAGILYIVSAGSEKLMETAKTAVKNTLVGFGIVLLGWVAVNAVIFYIGTKSDLGLGHVKFESWWKVDLTCAPTVFNGGNTGGGEGGGGNVCGDGVCGGGETATSCPADCSSGTVSFGKASYEVTETGGPQTVNITVQRSGAKFGAVGVRVKSQDNGSAKPGEDYVSVNADATWGNGENGEKTISVVILGDVRGESLEAFGLEISITTGDAALKDPKVASIIIHDDD